MCAARRRTCCILVNCTKSFTWAVGYNDGLIVPPERPEIVSLKILHNPRCSKSRATLALLEERGLQPEIVAYLENPPSADELRSILDMLERSPRELMRTGQSEYRDLGLDQPGLSDDQLVAAMIATPILIERPIVISNGQARIGRPPESVLEII